jgi:amino acid transporter
LVSFFALAFGSMIGVGWVTAMGSWLTQAGPAGAIVAFLGGGATMLLIGLCYAELTPMLPVAGGEVAYAYRAFGTGKAFLAGWFLAFGYISVSGFEAISVGRVLAYMYPGIDRWPLYEVAGGTVYLSHLLLGAAFTALITWINYSGVARAGAFQVTLTFGFIGVAVLFILVGIGSGDLSNAEPFFPRGAGFSVWGGVLAVFVTAPFWFVGFDTIPQGAEEANASVRPRQLGTVILLSISAATLFYVALIAAVSLVGPWELVAARDLPTARAFDLAFDSRVWTQLVLVAALVGLLTSWNGFFLAASRVLFSLGRGRIISERLGETHPQNGTPHRAVVLTGLITLLAPFLGPNALLAFVDVGSFCIGVAFLSVALSTIRLRKSHPEAHRPYRIPGGLWIPYAAVAGSILILLVMVTPGSPAALVWPLEVGILVGFSVLGGLFWWAGRAYRTALHESERARLILERYADLAPGAADA